MSQLSLKQIEQMSQYLSLKELEKALNNALQEQQEVLNELATTTKKTKGLTLDEVLLNGGVTTIIHKDIKYRVSCLTPEMMQQYDNLSICHEQGIEVVLPPIFRFWIKTLLGSVFTIKCNSYTIAQEVVDEIFDTGRYRVSCSKI